MSATNLEHWPESNPFPLRYWWLRRVGLVALVYLLFVVGLRLYAGWKTEQLLDDEIAALRTRGVPVLPEDFNRPAVPDKDNAVTALMSAAAAFVDGPLEQLPGGIPRQIRDRYMSVTGPGSFVRAIRERTDEVGAVLNANRKALAGIREARDRPEADSGFRATSPMVMATLPLAHLSGCRNLARLARTHALYQHHTGNHAEAIESVLDGEDIARVLYQGSTLIEHLVGFAVDALAIDGLESMVPTLAVAGESRHHDGAVTPVPRERIEALIQTLLNEEYRRRGFGQVIRVEIATVIDSYRNIAVGSINPAGLLAFATQPKVAWGTMVPAPIGRPIWMREALDVARAGDSMADAATAPTWAHAAPLPPEFSGSVPTWLPYLGLRGLLSPSLERAFKLHFRTLTIRRMAAAALAIRLYELDYGRRPERLEDLVPAYLPEVPLDALDPAGGPLRYRPHASPPLLYSVGMDAIDDGGIPLEWRKDVSDERIGDELFYLNGDRPEQIPHMWHVRPTTQELNAATRAAGEDGAGAEQP